MRGADTDNESLLSTLRLEAFVLAEPSLRRTCTLVDSVLDGMNANDLTTDDECTLHPESNAALALPSCRNRVLAYNDHSLMCNARAKRCASVASAIKRVQRALLPLGQDDRSDPQRVEALAQ